MVIHQVHIARIVAARQMIAYAKHVRLVEVIGRGLLGLLGQVIHVKQWTSTPEYDDDADEGDGVIEPTQTLVRTRLGIGYMVRVESLARPKSWFQRLFFWLGPVNRGELVHRISPSRIWWRGADCLISSNLEGTDFQSVSLSELPHIMWTDRR